MHTSEKVKQFTRCWSDKPVRIHTTHLFSFEPGKIIELLRFVLAGKRHNTITSAFDPNNTHRGNLTPTQQQ